MKSICFNCCCKPELPKSIGIGFFELYWYSLKLGASRPFQLAPAPHYQGCSGPGRTGPGHSGPGHSGLYRQSSTRPEKVWIKF